MGSRGRYIAWRKPALYLYFIGVAVVLDWIIYIAMLICCLCGYLLFVFELLLAFKIRFGIFSVIWNQKTSYYYFGAF